MGLTAVSAPLFWQQGAPLGGLGNGADQFHASRAAFTHGAPGWQAAPLAQFAEGLRPSLQPVADALHWGGLLGDQRVLATAFSVPLGAPVYTGLHFWLRRRGQPGPLRLALCADAAGSPGAPLPGGLATLTAEDLPGTQAEWREIPLPALGLLDAGDYHLLLYADPADTASDGWQVGLTATANALTSAAGSNWQTAAAGLAYRLTADWPARRYHCFTLAGSLYAAETRADGQPGRLYLNGGRGLATSAADDTLTDTRQNWPPEAWAGSWVWLRSGTGTGQRRRISGNDANTLAVSPAWEALPDATSEYLIYATVHWQDITPVSGALIDGVVSSVAVVNDEAHLAQGKTISILRMRWNPAASPPTHEFMDDGGMNADLMYTFYHPGEGVQIWRARNDNMLISRGAPASWGATTSYGSGIPVGDASQPITRLLDQDGALLVFKTDSLWRVEADEPRRLNLGLDQLPDPHNGVAACLQGGAALFSWADGVARLERDQLTEGGPPLAGGRVTALLPLGPARLLAAWQRQPDSSAQLLLQEGAAWHPLWQGAAGLQGVFAQPCPGSLPWLWLESGGELLGLPLPEPGAPWPQDLPLAPEAMLESPALDFEAPFDRKIITEVRIASHGRPEFALEAQLDDEIGGEAWRRLGESVDLTDGVLPLNLPPARRARFRLRLDATPGEPPRLLGWQVVARQDSEPMPG